MSTRSLEAAPPVRGAAQWCRAVFRPTVGALALTAALSGCGRRATLAECQEIVARVVRLELAADASADAVTEAIGRAQTQFREQALRECVGRRIREDTLTCVRAAKSADSLLEDCFSL